MERYHSNALGDRPRLFHHIVSWEKPKQGGIKCNTDEVSRKNLGSSAYCFYLRNDKGEVIHAEAEGVGSKSNMEVEVTAVKKALEYCMIYKLKRVLIETNSLGVTKMVKREWKISWHLVESIQYIQEVMQSTKTEIRHILR